MWVRSVNGKLIEINRSNYSSCVEYYVDLSNAIINANIIANEERKIMEYIVRIIKGGNSKTPFTN